MGASRQPAPRLALVGYTPEYFLPFAHVLERAGFTVFWVAGLRSDAERLLSLGVPPSQVLDVTVGLEECRAEIDACRKGLAPLEAVAGPRINDIILMDRILRRVPQDAALRYLWHVQQQVRAFFAARDITLVSSGRDTALQLTSMLVSRVMGIPWVVPTRLRIPKDVYLFCSGHDTADVVRLREPREADRHWAETLLDDFTARKSAQMPALKRAARGFGDVVQLLPDHVRLFAAALRAARSDRGNLHARYTAGRLVRMYVSRRWNLLRYRMSPPFAAPGAPPFCLYALHTQPESSIDVVGSFFSDQIALVRFIARSLPVSHELYVKVHPTDVDGQPLSFYRTLAAIPGVRLIDHGVPTRDLLSNTAIVFSLTGTIGYEAGLMGTPVVTFARNYFNALPSVHYCDAPPQLPALIERLLAAPPPVALRQRTIAALADWKAQAFEGEVNRMYGEHPSPLTQADLETLREAYITLHGALAGCSAEALHA